MAVGEGIRPALEFLLEKLYSIRTMINQQKLTVEKGKDIFYKLKPSLEKKYKPGDFVTIEVNTGKFFIGKNPIEAISKAKKHFPRKQFFLAQVGRAAGILK